jgi:hypothetical protein
MVEARHLKRYQQQYFSYFDRYEILPNKYEMLNVSLFDLRKFYKKPQVHSSQAPDYYTLCCLVPQTFSN